MLGTWVRQGADAQTREVWREAGEGVWRGEGLSGNAHGEALQVVETLLMVEMSGEIFYLAKVGHNPRPIPFKLVEQDIFKAVFANPEHDFPQKLVYQLAEEGTMTVDVSDGGEKGFHLKFEKLADG